MGELQMCTAWEAVRTLQSIGLVFSDDALGLVKRTTDAINAAESEAMRRWFDKECTQICIVREHGHVPIITKAQRDVRTITASVTSATKNAMAAKMRAAGISEDIIALTLAM
jgi:hypothetical protein